MEWVRVAGYSFLFSGNTCGKSRTHLLVIISLRPFTDLFITYFRFVVDNFVRCVQCVHSHTVSCANLLGVEADGCRYMVDAGDIVHLYTSRLGILVLEFSV